MRDLNALPLPELFAVLAALPGAMAWAEAAALEDLGVPPRDATSEALIDERAQCAAAVVARQAGVVAGLAALPALATRLAPGCDIKTRVQDGDRVGVGAELARLVGPTRGILALERTCLNMLGRLSGIATRTAGFVRRTADAAPGRRPAVCDTRKTTPGLRAPEKYAVRCGGGTLHRVGLYDAMLIKDNHLRALGADADLTRLIEPVGRARRGGGLRFVELEVDTLAQCRAALALPAGLIDIVLLDNFGLDALAEAVALRDTSGVAVLLEASGGVTLETVGAVAETGVDRISVGALTHSAPALDVALEIV